VNVSGADIQINKDVKIRIRTLVEQSRKKDAKLKDEALTELENYGRAAVPVLKELLVSDAALFDPNENLVENIDSEVWKANTITAPVISKTRSATASNACASAS